VATAADDGTVRIWDVGSGKQILMLPNNGWLRPIAVSPDGTRLVSSSLDNSVSVWELPTGRRVFNLTGHGKRPGGGHRAVSFTPDGKHFLTSGDDFYLREWDVATGKAVRELRLQPKGVIVPAADAENAEDSDGWHRNRFIPPYGEAKFTPDGTKFVLAIRNEIHVFDVGTGKDLLQIPNDCWPISLAISPDSKTLLATVYGKLVETKLPDGSVESSAAKNDSAHMWDLNTGNLLTDVPLPRGRAGPVAFSPNGKLFAMAMNMPEGPICVRDVEHGEKVAVIQGFRGKVHSLAFAADGKRLISGMSDTTGLVWDLAMVLDLPIKR